MDLSAALKNVSLRSTVNHESANVNSTVESLKAAVQAEKANNQKLRDVDLESWYDRLKQWTYETVFVSVTPQECEILMQIYKSPSTVETQQREIIDLLKKRIDVAIQPFSNGVFAKLSSRSPKDSAVAEQKALEMIKKRLTQTERVRVDANFIKTTVMECGIKALKASNADDVIDLLTSSDRVCDDDIPLALSFPDVFDQHIVLREWIDIPTCNEFRAFVFDRQLTACAQYFCDAYFPQLVENQIRIANLLRAFFETIKDAVALDEYVLDLAVDLKTDRVLIIELNPFGKPSGCGTGTPLFNCREEHDFRVLFGEAPFELRVQTEKPTTLQNVLRDGPLKQWLLDQKFIDENLNIL
eukprot:CAMPEP_0168605554 /NCGR_PEP_ID=MMETSP0420-20121227/16045_1 /TAXON_ID=498008 /ORGANISM="Pessonella sp." /LENGTH=355 /DNA_ID=CAMNT_0008645051 /DNA_START=22 /DNA_END=1089 /DNA_ORIENTATION=-